MIAFHTPQPSELHCNLYLTPCIKESNLYAALDINNFNKGWLVVTRSLKSMEIHNSCSNIG